MENHKKKQPEDFLHLSDKRSDPFISSLETQAVGKYLPYNNRLFVAFFLGRGGGAKLWASGHAFHQFSETKISKTHTHHTPQKKVKIKKRSGWGSVGMELKTTRGDQMFGLPRTVGCMRIYY